MRLLRTVPASLLSLAALAGCVHPPIPTGDPLNDMKPRRAVRVVEVVDLNRIKLEDGRTIRMHGVAAPPADHAAFAAGSQWLRDLLEGKQVVLDDDEENFYANDWHSYVFLPDDPARPRFMNGELVRKGFAYAFTTPPNERYEPWLLEQQFEAREEHIGVWADRPPAAEYYVTDRMSNYFHRKECPNGAKLHYPDRYGSRADALSDHKMPCPDCRP